MVVRQTLAVVAWFLAHRPGRLRGALDAKVVPPYNSAQLSEQPVELK